MGGDEAGHRLRDDTFDLEYHGDQAVGPGLIDLAVNVSQDPPPAWLTEAIAEACQRLAPYPHAREATEAIAAFHHRRESEVLITAGAAEAFGLLARALTPGVAMVIHPQFTEPERALRLAGHTVRRHIVSASDNFRLDGTAVPCDPDVVVIGNPTNPTGVVHPASSILSLARPGRVVVVDEAFMDAVPEEIDTLTRGVVDGDVVVVRSLTKTWGLAGLRVGYVMGPERIIRDMRVQQTPWSVSTPALAAARACASDQGREETHKRATTIELNREDWRGLVRRRGLIDVPNSRGPFLLLRDPWGPGLVPALREYGIAVRRCDTFPGLSDEWLRIAIRGFAERDRLLSAIDAYRQGSGSSSNSRCVAG